MVEPKKLTVQARDRKLQEHAQAIQATLKDQGLLDALDGSYPGISSISVERGKAFGLMGFDESSGTLRVQVNPSSPKQTRQQFAGLGKKLASKPRASLSVKPAVDLDLSFASPPAGPRSYTHRGLTFKPVDVPEDVLNAQAYSGAFKIPSRASIQDAHDQYFVASFIASDGSSRLTSQGIPIMDQQEANIMRVRRTSTGSLMGYPFRQDSDSDSITVPVLGDFYSGGGKITDRLEEEGVIERVRHDGKQLTTAVYVKTARQLYLPVSGSIQMINIGGRRIIPNSYEALSQAWELMSDGQTAGGMATDSLAKLTDDALEAAYQQKPEGTLEQFKAKNIDSYGVEVGMLSLQEALEKPEKARQLGLDTSKLAIEQARVCGVGIKGAGCLGYDGCYLDHKRGDPLPDGFRLHSQDDDETAYGVYETYYHARGLVLPVAHQQDAGTPVGAVTPVDRLSFDRENLLLKNGAVLSYITCAVIPLVTKEHAPDMVCDEIALVTNCVLDDSRRVDELFHKKAPLIEKRRTYAAICTEKYSNESPTDGLTDDFARRNFSVARDKHWKILATNVGRNIRALFDSNLTNPKNQNLNGNISIDGGLADVIDLTTMKKPSDIHSTINHAFGGLSNYYEVAGYEAQDFFKSTPFANLLKNCLGGEAGAQLAKRLKGELAGMGRGDLGLCIGKAAGLLTDELVKLKGSTERSVYQMPDEEVLELLKQDVGLRKACDLTPSSLGELERSMVSGIPLSRMTPRGFVQVDPRKELDKHRARVDDQLRTETVTSMKENGLELSRLYAERYDPQNSLSL